MNEAIGRQLKYLNSRAHRALRRALTREEWIRVSAEIQDSRKSLIERHTRRLELFLQTETPVLLEDTSIQLIRTIDGFPDIYAPGEMERIRETHFVHEQGKVFNIACDYATVLREGLEGRRARLHRGLAEASAQQVTYAGYVERTLDAVEAFADRYADLEERSGMEEHAAMLRRVVRHGAATLAEAMQLFRVLHFVLWVSGAYHCTVGRFDQYMHPFYLSDRERGILDDEGALDLIEDFFLSFNRDSDLYCGIMQGDNGQSMVLGGCLSDGSCAVNPLTYLAIRASLELRQIDPKLNLRCDKNTPEDLYELGTQLTRAGMGFPQYANDEVVIPGLVAAGYGLVDARDYVVAACWEFIIPGVAMDIPNIGAVSLAQVTRETILKGLPDAPDFGTLKDLWQVNLNAASRAVHDDIHNLYLEPAPYHSALMAGCMEEKRDISLGAKYNNFGFHGTGFSCAVDQMAAVEKFVFLDKAVSKERLLTALTEDFESDPELKYLLRHKAPKLGRDIETKILAEELIDLFADSLKGLINERGGITRGGSGSAMYYLWHAERLGATADGRGSGEPLPANFSPSLFLSDAGVLSLVSGFTENNLSRIPNGGPFTLELHDSIFSAPDSIEKVARMVRAYIRMGGHQMQLNAVNSARLRDAQQHPENHGDLVVRVWGWSGHFVELEKRYQDQIISRTEFAL